MSVDMRPYQRDAFDSIRREWVEGRKKTVICLPTGTGKCGNLETFCWSGGLRRFGEMFNSKATHIATPTGMKEIAGWHDDGVREGIKVTLECGLTFDGTHEHRIWVRRDNGFEGWVKLGELEGNEYAAVARGHADWGSEHFSFEDAYLMGLLVADVSIHDKGLNDGSSHLSVTKHHLVLTNILPTLNRWHTEAADYTVKLATVHPLSPLSASVTMLAPDWNQYLRNRFGYVSAPSGKRTVPTKILSSNRSSVAAFLRGYFDGGGGCGGKIQFSSASEELIDQVHQLLLGLGVYCAKRTKPVPGHQDAYILAVRDVQAFDREVGCTRFGITKDKNYDKLLVKKWNKNVETVPGVGQIIAAMAATIPCKWKRKDAWRFASAYYDSAVRKPSYDMLRELVEAAPPSSAKREAERILGEHYAWSRIQSVVPSTCRRIDCCVPDGEQYIGNGLINHNTVIFLFVIYHAMKNGLRSLVLANTDELVNQAKEKLVKVGIKPGIVKAGKDEWDNEVVVASIQTISRSARLQNIAPNHFGVVITDECHFANSPTYQRVLQYFDSAWQLGVTATPFRGDKASLANAGWDSMAYVYSLQEAMKDGWLCPAKFIRVDTGQDLGALKKKTDEHTGEKDFSAKELEKTINNQERNCRIVQSVYPYLNTRKFLAFCAGVNHAVDLANAFRIMGVPAWYVSGDMKLSDRRKLIAAHARGAFPVLTNCAVLTHGYDDPALSAIIMARPTESKVLYIQEIGRGLRPHPGKKDCLVFDVVDVSAKHSLQIGSELIKLEEKIEERNRGDAEVQVAS